jgi:hypothetical protein
MLLNKIGQICCSRVNTRPLEPLLSENIPDSLKIACETTYACLCACSGVANRRAESFTQAVFDLETFSTAAGGSLPLQAHACRLDPDRLAVIVDPGAPSLKVSRHAGRAVVDCRSVQVTRVSLLNALRAMPGVVTRVADRMAASTADVFTMPNGIIVEVTAHLDDRAVIAAVTLRSATKRVTP